MALLEKEGAVGVPLSQVFLLPVLRDFAHSLAFRHVPVQEAQLVHCAAQRYSPFELTDVQRAYLMGRQSGVPTGWRGNALLSGIRISGIRVSGIRISGK